MNARTLVEIAFPEPGQSPATSPAFVRTSSALLKVTIADCDWKDSFDEPNLAAHVNSLKQAVGGEAWTSEFDVSDQVDSLVMFIASSPLDDSQMQQLWDAGDLALGDQVFEGNSFEEVLAAVSAYVEAEAE